MWLANPPAAKKLREASSGGSFEQVLGLLRSGANVRKQDSKGRTALHFASCRGESDIGQCTGLLCGVHTCKTLQ
jgi:ankyrin repeat protein